LKALIVVDMLNDFVTGALANRARSERILPSIKRLLDHARSDDDWLVVYANDAHRADDRELAIWGRHALAGTPGAAVIDALAPIGAEREIVCPKRHYNAFDGTDLEDTLIDYDVASVVLCGQHTHCAISHTAYGAFLTGYDIVVPTDAVCAIDDVDEAAALGYLRDMYGVTLTSSTSLIGRPILRTASFNPSL
jgi:nicotinamidase-related amidase